MRRQLGLRAEPCQSATRAAAGTRVGEETRDRIDAGLPYRNALRRLRARQRDDGEAVGQQQFVVRPARGRVRYLAYGATLLEISAGEREQMTEAFGGRARAIATRGSRNALLLGGSRACRDQAIGVS